MHVPEDISNRPSSPVVSPPTFSAPVVFVRETKPPATVKRPPLWSENVSVPSADATPVKSCTHAPPAPTDTWAFAPIFTTPPSSAIGDETFRTVVPDSFSISRLPTAAAGAAGTPTAFSP